MKRENPGFHRIFITGAHYDTFYESPGADDNASGVSVLLELVKYFSNRNLNYDIRFVFFPNEEPPFFDTPQMGSEVYVNEILRREEKIELMICLESIGYYSDKKGSQDYPFPLNFFYPDTANFISIISNLRSKDYMKEMVKFFKKNTCIDVKCLAFPPVIPGMTFSDHYPFWRRGFKALMITDTAFLRNPNYHTKFDLPHTLNYEKLFEVYKGILSFIELSNSPF